MPLVAQITDCLLHYFTDADFVNVVHLVNKNMWIDHCGSYAHIFKFNYSDYREGFDPEFLDKRSLRGINVSQPNINWIARRMSILFISKNHGDFIQCNQGCDNWNSKLFKNLPMSSGFRHGLNQLRPGYLSASATNPRRKARGMPCILPDRELDTAYIWSP